MDEIAAEKIIDWAMIMDVCGYEDMAKEIIKLSLKDARQTVGLLAKAVKAGNPENVALYAHRLKGVAMTMGATQLSEKAYCLECAGDKEDIEAAPLLLDDAKDEFEKVMLFLSRANWIEKAKQQNDNKEQLDRSSAVDISDTRL